MPRSRENYIYLAKLAEESERYGEMVENMKLAVSAPSNQELTVEERNLLSVAYKNVVGARRKSWRVLAICEAEESKGSGTRVSMIKGYRENIEQELTKICEDILEALERHLIPSGTSVESKVFWQKMMGDYHRHLAEFGTGDKRRDSADKSYKAYSAASDIAVRELLPTNPIRLGLALNFSVFYYEIRNLPHLACGLAAQAFGDASAELDTLSEENHIKTTCIMRLLEENRTHWTSHATIPTPADKPADAKEGATEATAED